MIPHFKWETYVSTLLFRHLVFQGSPYIPAIFMIHERRFTETHQDLFKQAGNLIPSIKSSLSMIEKTQS